ncbi:MAG: hypothetical protein P1R58_10865 [bacterium]|nr:hypothetical protein [bacterium]
MYDIVYTAIATITGGVLIYVIGRIVEKIHLEPVHEFRKARGRIAIDLRLLANIYANPGSGHLEIRENAEKILRRDSADLWGNYYSVPIRNFWILLQLIPSKLNLDGAAKNLVFLSNSIRTGNADKADKNVEKAEEALVLLGLQKEKPMAEMIT